MLTPKVNPAGTSHIGYVVASPANVLEALGSGVPEFSDYYKTTRDYVFTIEGRVLALYDWKLTSLYDERLPTPEAFWSSDEPVMFNVGGHPDEDDERKDAMDALVHYLAYRGVRVHNYRSISY